MQPTAKRLLVVANDFPYPPSHGAAVDMWNRMLILKDMGYKVDLLASVTKVPGEDRISVVKSYVENIWIVSRQSTIASFLSLTPFQVRSRQGLRNVALNHDYHGVILEADYVAPILENPAIQDSKRILRIHNEQVGYFRDLAEGAGSWLKKLYFYSESFKFRLFSSSVMEKCDLLWFISDSEREAHVRESPKDSKKSLFLPTHVNPEELRSFTYAPPTALFLGTLTISHNSDSIVWYVANVHPMLNDLADYGFQVAGRTAGRPIDAVVRSIQQYRNISLEKDPVAVEGLYARASVFVNPVIRGAGVKIKVVQALQAGLPVVSTSMGIEGTGFRDSVHVLIGDTPEAFAACVRRVLTEQGLAEWLVRNAQDFIKEQYDMKVNMRKTLADLLESNKMISICGKR